MFSLSIKVLFTDSMGNYRYLTDFDHRYVYVSENDEKGITSPGPVPRICPAQKSKVIDKNV